MVQPNMSHAQVRLAKELRDVQQDEAINASIGLENDDDLFLWNVTFEGPEDSLYEGGYFKATLRFPTDYPNNPPEMKFVCPMWHPNIYPDGKVCISILHPPGTDATSGESADERWRPILNVEAILVSVMSMLNDPNISSPANIDASVEFRDNFNEYKKKVLRLTQRSIDYI